MDHIIAGHFATKASADVAAAALVRYIASTDISIFHNNPPGQHGVRAVGGDEKVDAGSAGAGEQAASTALAAGLTAGAIGMVGGPVTALAAAGVAAYTGSLIGALDGLGANGPVSQLPNQRPAGIILAVRIVAPDSEKMVINDLQFCGAEGIERAEGQWRNGDWSDFNPLEKPQQVDLA